MPIDPRDILDLSTPGQQANMPVTEADQHESSARQPRPFLMLTFRCANQYARAYKSEDGREYVGRCPTCGKTVTFAVGEGGTSRRSFDVSCR